MLLRIIGYFLMGAGLFIFGHDLGQQRADRWYAAHPIRECVAVNGAGGLQACIDELHEQGGGTVIVNRDWHGRVADIAFAIAQPDVQIRDERFASEPMMIWTAPPATPFDYFQAKPSTK